MYSVLHQQRRNLVKIADDGYEAKALWQKRIKYFRFTRLTQSYTMHTIQTSNTKGISIDT